MLTTLQAIKLNDFRYGWGPGFSVEAGGCQVKKRDNGKEVPDKVVRRENPKTGEVEFTRQK